MQIGFKTDKGKKRDKNEDAVFLMPEQGLFMVADGVGGHNSGEIASRTAVGSIAEYVKNRPLEDLEDEEQIKGYFLDCLRKANLEVYNLALSQDEYSGMATTVVIAYIKSEFAYILNVGDSRGYMIRDYNIEQITEDHTYVNELMKTGQITSEEAHLHPQKHMITRALGGERSVKPDLYKIKLYKGDILCLCSDGLYNEIPPEEICRDVSAAPKMSKLVENLVEKANDNGGHDNITVICIKI